MIFETKSGELEYGEVKGSISSLKSPKLDEIVRAENGFISRRLPSLYKPVLKSSIRPNPNLKMVQ